MRFDANDLRAAFLSSDVAVDQAPTAEEIRALLDGEGDEAARLTTLARLVSTPEGRRELAMHRALRAGVDDESVVPNDAASGVAGAVVEIAFPSPPARHWPQWLRPIGLAAAALLIAIVGVDRFLSRPATDAYRSATVSLMLVAPLDGAQRNGATTFVWRSIPRASYEFELYSADGRAIVQRATPDTVLALPAGSGAGEYRWWVTAQLEDGTQVRSAARRLVLR